MIQRGSASIASVAGLSRAAFFDRVTNRLRDDLPPALANFQTRRFSHLLKIFYVYERIHYEMAIESGRGQIEIGLHFEDGPQSTEALLRWFDGQIVEIKHVLGSEVDLERWTTSWGHLYEIWPLTPLDRQLADRAAGRLVEMIVLLQPLLEAAAVPPETDRAPTRRWRR